MSELSDLLVDIEEALRGLHELDMKDKSLLNTEFHLLGDARKCVQRLQEDIDLLKESDYAEQIFRNM